MLIIFQFGLLIEKIIFEMICLEILLHLQIHTLGQTWAASLDHRVTNSLYGTERAYTELQLDELKRYARFHPLHSKDEIAV